MQVGTLRGGHQFLDELLDHGLQPRIVIDTAVSRQYALMLAQHRRRHLGFRGLRNHGRRRMMLGGWRQR